MTIARTPAVRRRFTVPTARFAHSRRALSLLEVTVATLLLLVLIAIAFESSFAALQASTGKRMDADLALEADRIFGEVRSDLLLSGWHFIDSPVADPATDQPGRIYYPKVIQQAPFGAGSSAALRAGWPAPAPGTANSLAHFIRDDPDGVAPGGDLVRLQELPAGLPGNRGDGVSPLDHLAWGDFGTWFSGDSTASPDAGTPSALEATLYRESWLARSQELIFLRAQMGEWQPDPAEQDRVNLLNFGGVSDHWRLTGGMNFTNATQPDEVWNRTGVIRPSEWEVQPAAVPGRRTGFLAERPGAPPGLRSVPEAFMHGAYGFFDGGSSELLLETRWETRVHWDTLTTSDFIAAPGGSRILGNASLREYTYALIPSPVGVGRLVRAYSENIAAAPGRRFGAKVGEVIGRDSGTGAQVVIDAVLSDHVCRVLFDTYRTDATLALNQVRLRLFLAIVPQADPSRGIQLHRTDATFTMQAADSDSNNVDNRSRFTRIARRFPY